MSEQGFDPVASTGEGGAEIKRLRALMTEAVSAAREAAQRITRSEQVTDEVLRIRVTR